VLTAFTAPRVPGATLWIVASFLYEHALVQAAPFSNNFATPASKLLLSLSVSSAFETLHEMV
jgi:hypothetical protein